MAVRCGDTHLGPRFHTVKHFLQFSYNHPPNSRKSATSQLAGAPNGALPEHESQPAEPREERSAQSKLLEQPAEQQEAMDRRTCTEVTDIMAASGSPQSAPHPITPDGRYLIVRGRLWRRSNPRLTGAERQMLVDTLMAARRAVGQALRQADEAALALARARVDAAKVALGERGPVWWDDGKPDLNRRMVRNTPYKGWFETLAPDR